MSIAPLLVRASAGTGKTYRLTGRLLAILAAGADPSSILATTFTRKAAGEILQRILTALAAAARDPASLDSLRAQTGIPDLSADDCCQLLHRVVRDIHRVRICTLDSLFSQLARSFPFELRLPAGWRLTDEIEETWLQSRAIDATLSHLEADSLISLISMLGKGDAIRSIESELRSIIVDGFNHSRWADAAAWKQVKIPAAVPPEEIRDSVEVLRRADVGHKSADKQLVLVAEMLDSSDPSDAAGKTPVQNAGKTPSNEAVHYYGRDMPDDVGQALRVAHRVVRRHVLGLLMEQTGATGEILQHYAVHIDAIKEQTRSLSFDDVAFRLATWIQALDFDVLGSRLDAAIEHVLLDEFQDTSPVQWSVIRPLAQRAAASAAGSFFCVGDTKQAIYGWRGGEAAIFDQVTEEITGIEQQPLDDSYRSSPVISQLVNDLFSHLDRHPKLGRSASTEKMSVKDRAEQRAVTEFVDQFPTHRSARTELPGYVEVCTGPALPERGAGAQAETRHNRLQYAAELIAQLASEAPTKSIGVLTRTNQSVATLIYFLKQRDVDVSQEGGNPLVDSSAVELVLSALMLSEHPGDLRWAYHVAHSPLGDALGLKPWDPGNDHQQVLQQVSAASFRVRRLVERKGLSRSVVWMGDALMPSCGEGDSQRLRQLVDLAHTYEAAPQPRLSRFVEIVRVKRVERPRQAQVRVMTVHQSKGLEFDAVVLPELNGNLVQTSKKIIARRKSPAEPPDGLLRYLAIEHWEMLSKPWQAALAANAEAMMTEALCLLYVAVTRARMGLYLVVDPSSNPDVATRTPAALVYHALGCDADPTQAESILYRSGDPRWFASPPA